ncbi:hypothetical protein [Tetragenococcus halophilus]|uniref:Uncharacterized protein n=1 Tax=Tetragenococcus halophilus TaxID=51669 RepID=A0AB37D264_TETHA|nr:hypothetical protein [Tetragenococcus halophilus]QGP76001.1 hypothetical protein GLW17_03675 [Tetragenococcus halophilus]GMG69226.1 hypothetical protein TEHMS4_21630 [Tetragenococcus halophilus]
MRANLSENPSILVKDDKEYKKLNLWLLEEKKLYSMNLNTKKVLAERPN